MQATPEELLYAMVATPSVNPAHSSDTRITGETRMADLLTPWLEQRGLTVERQEPLGPGRPAVLAASAPAAHRLLFGVHLDTVGVDHMTIPPFQPALKDGRIYGRGTCDMKGSTAALLAALTPQRVASLQDRDVQVMVVGTPDEECGVKGAEALSRSGLRADAAVVLEPTRNIPVVAHKGAHWADIVLKGKSGHGSQPASGISTHVALAHLLPRLLEFQEHCAKEYTHPLLGSSTLNIGQITGGITYNIIPDQTCIRIDRRRIPNEPAREFDGAVRDLLEELVHRNLLLEASMTVVSDTPAFATRPDSPLVIRLTDAIESITGQRPAPEGTSWVSDASPFSRVCDEILVFGPGDIAQAHTEDEFIEEASLHEGTRILGAFLDAYGRPT